MDSLNDLILPETTHPPLSLLEAVTLFNDHSHLRSLVCKWELETGYRLLSHEFTEVFAQVRQWERDYSREMNYVVFCKIAEKIIH